MTDVERIRHLVRRAERRLALLWLQDITSRAAAIALALFATTALAGKAGWIAVPLWAAAATLAVASSLWIAFRAFGRPRLDEAAAARIDEAYGLEDRLRSALSLVEAESPRPMEEALVADAARASGGADPARAIAYRRPAWAAGLAAASAVALVAALVPQRLLPGAEAGSASENDIRDAGRALEARSVALAQRNERIPDEIRNLARDQALLGSELARQPDSPREALAELGRLEDRIDRAARGLHGAEATVAAARRAMQEALSAAGTASNAGSTRDASGAESTGSNEQRGQLSESAREAARRAGAGQLTEQSAEALARAAEALAGELGDSESDRELQEALAALRDGDVTARELERLAEALERAEASAVARDVAEELRAANRAAKQRVAGRAPGRAADEDGDAGNGPFAGRGTTNDPEGAPYETEEQPSTMRSREVRPDARADFEARGESRRIGEQGYSARARGRLDGNGQGTSLFVQAAPGAPPATAPYQRVYPQYRRSAERSIERSAVPPERRSVVRDYFDAINPDGQ